jgi:Fuc2NAc and GlcNAc transferase
MFACSAFLVSAYKKIAIQFNFFDVPNERSAHATPKPRGAGIIFAGLWFIALLVLFYLDYLNALAFSVLFFPSLIVTATGFIDDLKNLSIKIRFLAYLVASVLAVGLLFFHSAISFFEIAVSVFCIFFITWSINLYNFMDGSDGLAAMEGVFILAVGALLFFHAQAPGIALGCLMLMAALMGFLIFNWPPAKLFMGDGGSAFLGCVIACMMIMGKRMYGIPVTSWIIVYGFFLYDATVTLLRRMMRGENWRQSHCAHAYQRLIQSGWTHLQVLLYISAINFILALLAMAVLVYPTQEVLLLAVAVVLLSINYAFVEYKKPYCRNLN